MMTHFLHFFKTENNKFEGRILYPGTECDFLIFLLNTSNFHWRKKPDDITPEDLQIQTRSFISKLCAIGYLMQPIKFRKDHRAIIAVNGGNYPEGRNGKSIFSDVLCEILPSIKLYGSKDMERSKLALEKVTTETKLIAIDNIYENFDLSSIFSLITGDIVIHRRRKSSLSIPHKRSPKLLLVKDNPFETSGISYTERMWNLEFSDYYNKSHKPLDDFKNLFIDEWDEKQWSLLNQLLIDCMQLYSQFGMVATSENELEVQRYSMN